jgi:very-short-patch-repair endonuclease
VLAGQQHGVVSATQLLEAGMTRSAIRHRVRTGRLHRLHAGVYAVGRPDLTREGRWMAAVLACGDGALLAGFSAARLWELIDRGGELPEVSVPTDTHVRGPRGVVVHRCLGRLTADAVQRAAIPVTSLQLTLIDLAGVTDQRRLRSAVRQAERVHRLDLRELRQAVDRPRTEARRARLRAVLDVYLPRAIESELEDALLELCRRHRLPLPDTQVRIGDHRVDFLWPDLRLVVETDGAQTHDTVVGRHNDRVKDRALLALGFEVVRFSYAEVVRQPGMVIRELRRHIARRRDAMALG